MADGLSTDAYDALVTAAETYRAVIVVRLAGEAGLRTSEITRVTPGHLRECNAGSEVSLLAVPTDADRAEHSDPDASSIDRETVLPSSLAAELKRYADSTGRGDDDPFVGVSPRRIQMIVSETADRAADRTEGVIPADVTPRDLRATFARRLLADRGVSPHAVREAGGWESLGPLDDYLGPLDGDAVADAVVDAVADDRSSAADAAAVAPSRDMAALPGFEAILDPGDSAEASGSDETSRPDSSDDASPLASVPDALTGGDRWTEAWVVRGWAGGELEEVVGAAGVDSETLVDRGATGDGPWRAAIDECEPVASDGHSVATGRPSLAVPVRYGEVTHGVLCLVAATDTPVSDTERRELSILGRCLGWAVTARRWHDLLHSDAVTEVAFRTADNGAFLARLSANLGCRIELSSTVSVDDRISQFYLSIEGARPQDIADVVTDAAGVSDLRVIETREGGCSVSVRVESGSAVRVLTEHGATVRDATAADGSVRIVADLPEGADVRPVAGGLRATFPDARLTSKESVARSPLTESSLSESVADRFTERQCAALSAAYHGGYFDWPRGSTAEEVADSMDISSPTFHNHIRKAQRALLDGLFENDRRR